MSKAAEFLNGSDSPAESDAAQAMSAPLIGTEYLTLQQLARELGLSPRTLARWHVQRVGPPRTCIGKLVLFRRASVLAWLQGHEENRKGRR
jgi:predicted DNA-binding transcriptional regulator AlpA